MWGETMRGGVGAEVELHFSDVVQWRFSTKGRFLSSSEPSLLVPGISETGKGSDVGVCLSTVGRTSVRVFLGQSD